jgi:hypothetical protein
VKLSLAVTVSLLVGFLCVPVNVPTWTAPYTFLFSKFSVAPTGLLVGILLYRRELVIRWSFGWLDLFMLIFIFMPLISFVGNYFKNPVIGLTKTWWFIAWYGFIYFIAIVSYRDKEDLLILVKVFLVFGLVYSLLGFYESIVGPQNYIAVKILGYSPPVNAHRLGGFRPSVFTEGLTFSFFYAWLAFVSWWMFFYAEVYKVRRVWLALAAVYLLGCEIWFRGIGGYVITLIGFACLLGIRRRMTVGIMMGLLVIVPTYMGLRIFGHLDQDVVANVMEKVYAPKVVSLKARLQQEDRAINKIKTSHPWIGNGPKYLYYWADGMWVVSIIEFGYIGMIAWWAGMICVPVCVASRYAHSFPAKVIRDDHKQTAEDGDTAEDWVIPVGLAIMVIMYGCDSMINHPELPLHSVFSAAIISYCTRSRMSAVEPRTPITNPSAPQL